MQRKLWVFSAVVLALAIGVFVPAAAQGDFTPEQQAALDDVRAAFLNFVGLNSYTADVIQDTDQDMTISMMGQSLRMVQTISADGTVLLARVEGAEYPNQSTTLNQTISQELTGMGQEQTTDLGPMVFDMIIADDRVYMQVGLPPEMAGYAPEGWQDVTDGAEIFPGMGAYDINQMLDLGGSALEAEFVNTLLDAATDIEVLPEGAAFDVPTTRYRLTLDTRQAFESLGLADLSAMFNAEEMPFDIPAMIELIYTDEDTRYVLELVVGVDDQMLYEYTQIMHLDILIGADMMTDPTLAGAEMTLAQQVTTTLRPVGFDEPVTITAPELAQ
ncbi:MAG: hypothetical protein JW910_21580 [Anaerolineae bacterium]|nr:hypothetical protein [Anaerolineae bacterium]